jgi:hypothetical protein
VSLRAAVVLYFRFLTSKEIERERGGWMGGGGGKLHHIHVQGLIWGYQFLILRGGGAVALVLFAVYSSEILASGSTSGIAGDPYALNRSLLYVCIRYCSERESINFILQN